MRVLAATVGALLISVSHIAFAQEHQGVQHGETAQTERQGEPAQLVAQSSEARPEESQQPAMQAQLPEAKPAEQPTAEQVLAQLPEAKPAEQPTAEQVLAQFPEAKPAEQPTAEQILAQLPEAKPAEQPTAEQVLAQLPEFKSAEKPAPTAEQVLAQLPGGKPAAQPAPTAEQVLAQLPGGKPGKQPAATANQILAQLPGGKPAKQPALNAEQLLAQLPGGKPATQQAALETPQDGTQGEDLRQPEAMKAEMQQDLQAEINMPSDPKWAALNEQNLGTTVDMPKAVFAMADGHAHKNVGRKYKTADGRAKVAVWTQPNAKRDTPEGYLRKTFKIPHATVDYQRATHEFAVVSGAYGNKAYYIRCNLSRSGNFHCFDLAFPVREKKSWEPVVTRMSHSLRALPLYY
jgi:hypothetical protein